MIDPNMKIVSHDPAAPDLIGLICEKCLTRIGVIADEITEETQNGQVTRVN